MLRFRKPRVSGGFPESNRQQVTQRAPYNGEKSMLNGRDSPFANSVVDLGIS